MKSAQQNKKVLTYQRTQTKIDEIRDDSCGYVEIFTTSACLSSSPISFSSVKLASLIGQQLAEGFICKTCLLHVYEYIHNIL